MSSTFRNFYDMAYIPCNPNPALHEAIKQGHGKLNVDGKSVTGGKSVDGKCHSGKLSIDGHYHDPAHRHLPHHQKPHKGNHAHYVHNNCRYGSGGWCGAKHSQAHRLHDHL